LAVREVYAAGLAKAVSICMGYVVKKKRRESQDAVLP